MQNLLPVLYMSCVCAFLCNAFKCDCALGTVEVVDEVQDLDYCTGMLCAFYPFKKTTAMQWV